MPRFRSFVFSMARPPVWSAMNLSESCESRRFARRSLLDVRIRADDLSRKPAPEPTAEFARCAVTAASAKPQSCELASSTPYTPPVCSPRASIV